MAAAAVCVLAAPPARAVVAICKWPADVPSQLLTSIDQCFTCYLKDTVVLANPCPPPGVPNPTQYLKVACYDFPESPSEVICDKIASAEVKGCYKAVQDAAKCNDVLNDANAKVEYASCSTLADPTDQKACSDSVQSDLSSLSASGKNAAAAGKQSCLDLMPSIRSLCLGEAF